MKLYNNKYRNKNVLITGHNGFKGSWLSLWLAELGATITGLSLPETDDDSHYSQLSIEMSNFEIDIREYKLVDDLIKKTKPEIIFHLAAQSLVRRSYSNPLETWSTNVMGTVNILEASRQNDCVKAVVVVTSDKCYENKEWCWGYRENDVLGGHDPYSASKAGAELVAQSFRKSYFEKTNELLIATARAGNVIGGGDWASDRLIPDAARAVRLKKPLVVRSPDATRPWQHVLESLSGYLLLGEKLLDGSSEYCGAWNFGPGDGSIRSVAQVLQRLKYKWNELDVLVDDGIQLHETSQLRLDSTKSHTVLNWTQTWNWEESIDATMDWYKKFLTSGDVISVQQLEKYISDAREKQCIWADE